MSAPGRLRAALAALLLAASCTQDDGRRFNPLELMTPDIAAGDERDLGFEFDQEIQKHFTILDDPVVADFLLELGLSIVDTLGDQPFVYHFRVLPDPSLNAFAVPGGFVYFHSGTILEAGSIHELAGVMAHEIGHVKGRHWKRMTEEAAAPNLLTSLAGIAATAATGEPGFVIAAQAANVGMQLTWSREYEAEADQLAVTFLRRAGYEPRGLVRFFERIVAEKESNPIRIPPYLYSHPQVEDRITVIEDLARRISPTGASDPRLERGLRAAQARLRLLLRMQRTTLPPSGPPPDHERTDPLLAWAEGLVSRGDLPAAAAVLGQTEASASRDPRVAFRLGEILERLGRREDAIAAYRKAVRLDPLRGQPYYRLGLVHRDLGDRQRAVLQLEQAARRFGERGGLRQRAEWEILKLTFPIVSSSGLADGRRSAGADTVAGTTRERFGGEDPRVVWWGEVTPRFLPFRERLRARWRDPEGRVVHESAAEPAGRRHAQIAFEQSEPWRPGRWSVDVLLEDTPVETRRFQVGD